MLVAGIMEDEYSRYGGGEEAMAIPVLRARRKIYGKRRNKSHALLEYILNLYQQLVIM